MPKYTVMYSRLVQIYYKPVEIEATNSDEAWVMAEQLATLELEEEGREEGLVEVVAVDGEDLVTAAIGQVDPWYSPIFNRGDHWK